MTIKVNVAIIGSGPAGLAAAIEIAKKGLSVVIIDEFIKPGGRLLGQFYEDPSAKRQDREWNGLKIALDLFDKTQKFNVKIFGNTTVWAVDRKWRLHLSGYSEKVIESDVLLLATGAAEKSLPIPGWTLPGVVSIGAAQVFTNLHHVSIGQRILVIGVDPLAISVALEMKKKGIKVAGVVLPPVSHFNRPLGLPVEGIRRLANVAEFSSNSLLRNVGKHMDGGLGRLAAHALKFNFFNIEGIPIYLRKSAIRIKGEGSVESVTMREVSIDGTPMGPLEEVEVDSVCLSGGLYPLNDLTQVAGCPMVDIPELGGLVPLHDSDMSTPVTGLFVAGNITGIESAKVAMAQGCLAGITILKYLGIETDITVQEAKLGVQNARDNSPFRFLPNIEEGRMKLNELWNKTVENGGNSNGRLHNLQM